MRVLWKTIVCDDSACNRRFMQTIIQKVNPFPEIQVTECQSGYDLLKVYSDVEPDIVFLDIGMPDLDGIETLRELKAKFRDARVVMTTSDDARLDVLQCAKLGIYGYILKPISADAIKDILGKLKKDVLKAQMQV